MASNGCWPFPSTWDLDLSRERRLRIEYCSTWQFADLGVIFIERGVYQWHQAHYSTKNSQILWKLPGFWGFRRSDRDSWIPKRIPRMCSRCQKENLIWGIGLDSQICCTTNPRNYNLGCLVLSGFMPCWPCLLTRWFRPWRTRYEFM